MGKRLNLTTRGTTDPPGKVRLSFNAARLKGSGEGILTYIEEKDRAACVWNEFLARHVTAYNRAATGRGVLVLHRTGARAHHAVSGE